MFDVETLKLLRAYLELDRDHALWEHEHRIDPPAEPRDVELEVDPGGGGGERRVGLLVASGEKLAHGRGVEGGVRVWARHGRRAYQTGGTTLVRGGLTKYSTCVHYLPWLSAFGADVHGRVS